MYRVLLVEYLELPGVAGRRRVDVVLVVAHTGGADADPRPGPAAVASGPLDVRTGVLVVARLRPVEGHGDGVQSGNQEVHVRTVGQVLVVLVLDPGGHRDAHLVAAAPVVLAGRTVQSVLEDLPVEVLGLLDERGFPGALGVGFHGQGLARCEGRGLGLTGETDGSKSRHQDRDEKHADTGVHADLLLSIQEACSNII